MAGFCWCGEIYGNCEHYGSERTQEAEVDELSCKKDYLATLKRQYDLAVRYNTPAITYLKSLIDRTESEIKDLSE